MTTPLVNPNRSTQTGGWLTRLNVGAGGYAMPGWTNIDSSPNSAADVIASVPPLLWADESVDEVYAGHFLEHLSKDTGAEFLRECYRVLKPGGRLGIVVPHTREIMRRYIEGVHEQFQVPAGQFWYTDDLDALCSVFIFSTVQESHHLWLYDLKSLTVAVEGAGFKVTGEIHPLYDPRIAGPAWWNLGVDAVKDS